MERYLFSVILVLLLSITGLGFFVAFQHPSETASLVPEATSAVQGAVVDATNTVTNALIGTTVTNSHVSEEAREGKDDTESGESDDDTARTSNTQTQATLTPAAQTSGAFTMAQVKAHNSASSCYTTVSGSVYDLTSFIGQHPGGEAAILSLCGTDGTAAGTAQHGGQRRPENELAALKIGILAK